MHPVTTTLDAIRSYSPCQDGWEKLLKSLGKTKADDEPLPLTHILKSNGLSDALWCLRCLPDEYGPLIVRFAADCAEHVLHVWEAKYPDDLGPRRAIEAARRWANNPTEENRTAARDAASAAYDAHAAASAAAHAATTTAYAAFAYAYAASAASAARAAAHAAASAAAADAAYAAAAAAANAANADADAAARAAEREYQAELFIKHFGDHPQDTETFMATEAHKKNPYSDLFEEGWSAVQREFSMNEPEPDKVFRADYSCGSYDGNAQVLYRRGDLYYEVTGNHCSCAGLEGQWEPEGYDKPTFIKMLERRGEHDLVNLVSEEK